MSAAAASASSGYGVTRDAAVGATQGLSVSKVTARKMVLVSTFALAAINIYRIKQPADGARDVTAYKRMWGTGVVGVILAVLADFAPQVAGPFAVLIVLGSLTNGGDQALLNALSGNFNVGPTTGGTRSPDNRGGTRGAGTTTTPRSTESPRRHTMRKERSQ